VVDRGYKCDVAIRCAGAAIVDIGDISGASEEHLLAALNEKTAAIVVVDNSHNGKIPLDRVVNISRQRDIPVLVDAAGSVPPVENFWRFTRDYGADAVIVSGGKGLRGPQSTGLVLGTRRMIEGCTHHGVPNSRIGRGMKVGKEEIVGIYTAVKLFMNDDHSAVREHRRRQIEYIASNLEALAGVSFYPRGHNSIEIAVDGAHTEADYKKIAQSLLDGEPPIYVGSSRSGLIVSSECLDEDQEQIVGAHLRLLLSMGSTNYRFH
jgi:L-seryl-tRNA(Ser) seleniumtransferase